MTDQPTLGGTASAGGTVAKRKRSPVVRPFSLNDLCRRQNIDNVRRDNFATDVLTVRLVCWEGLGESAGCPQRRDRATFGPLCRNHDKFTVMSGLPFGLSCNRKAKLVQIVWLPSLKAQNLLKENSQKNDELPNHNSANPSWPSSAEKIGGMFRC